VYDLNGTLVIDYSAAVNHGADRGFTGHEHLDELGLIHMNGRIYDPLLGLFVQADPLIQAPGDLQSFNRYSYVMNNPLAATDPSGYFSWRKFFKGPINVLRRPSLNSLHKWIHSDIHFQIGDDLGRRYPIVGQIGTIAVTAVVAIWCQPCAPAVAGAMTAATTYAQGADTNEYLRAGLVSTATAYAFYGVGSLTTPTNGQIAFGSANYFANVAGHAVVGCASAEAAGGDCGSGALSGAFGAAVAPALRGQDLFAGTVISAVVGGTGSVIGGGKFANGAVTGAFGYLFNEVRHTRGAAYDDPRTRVYIATVDIPGGDAGDIRTDQFPQHSFLLIEDSVTGESWIARAGPRVNGDLYLYAEVTIARASPDWPGTWTSQRLFYASYEAGSAVASLLNNYAQQVNRSWLPYMFVYQNSNSFAYGGAELLSGRRPGASGVNTPGWGFRLPVRR